MGKEYNLDSIGNYIMFGVLIVYYPVQKYCFQKYDNCNSRVWDCVLTSYQAHWLEKGYSGEIVSNGGLSTSPHCATGPLSVCFDATTYKVTPSSHRVTEVLVKLINISKISRTFKPSTTKIFRFSKGVPAIVGFLAGRTAEEWRQRKVQEEGTITMWHTVLDRFQMRFLLL